MGKVVVAAKLPGRIDEILAGHDVVKPAGAQMSREEVLANVADADALLTLLSLRIDDDLLSRAPKLRIVANYAVGYDNVDLAATGRRGILVTNTPDVLTNATADMAMALLLAAARRLGEGGELARSGAWHGWEPEQLPGLDLDGAQLGIVGLGRIGQAVAQRARGFGLRIVYAQPRRARADVESRCDARWLPVDELFATSDLVTLHCPATPETRRLVDARRIELMKPRAVLVNTARGAIVDEPALAEAVARGRLMAVGLDVFADEPRIHPLLVSSPRAILMPHLGSSTVGARRKMAEVAAQSIADALAGRRPAHVVQG
jgi:glyoxylate reductase